MFKLLLTALLLCTLTANAHTLPISYLTVFCDHQYAHFELTLNPFELSFFSELDRNTDGRLDPIELKESEARVAARIRDCFIFQAGGKVVHPEVIGLLLDVDSHHLRWMAHYRVDARTSALSIETRLSTITSGSHITQMTLLRSGERQLAQLGLLSPKAMLGPRVSSDGAASRLRMQSPLKRIGSLLLPLALASMTSFCGIASLILLSRRNTEVSKSPQHSMFLKSL